MTYNSPRTSHFDPYPLSQLSDTMKDPSAPKVKKEGSYYMDNYEATITVHTSPPQTRKQYFDFIEIDDETPDTHERVFPASKLSKRKNLKVTFSDHIEVDFIEDVSEYFSDGDYEEVDGFVEESLYEIPTDRGKGIRQLSSSAEFKSVTETVSPNNHRDSISSVSDSQGAKPVSSIKSPIIKQPKCQHQVLAAQQQQHQSQPHSHQQQALLQKRRAWTKSGAPASSSGDKDKPSLSDLEKRTKNYVTQLQEKTKKAETHARVAKALFPDITAKVKSQSNYKQFIANAKRAVEITRRYERPWVNGPGSSQPTYSVWKKKNESSIRRSSSLPKNFKLPDELAKRPGSENVLLSNRVRIKNT